MPRILEKLLDAYGAYTADSEAPEGFHLWVALGTIAGAAQRKISMSAAYFPVHTNMYLVLVSPPGVGKKSTALRVGKNFLKQVEPQTNFATESSSPEALIGLMAKIAKGTVKHQSLTLYSSELGTLMATNPAGMVDFLTDIYDGNPDWDRQTRSHGNEKIPRPWLNLMAATTPNWMGDNLSSTAVEGGFVARSIFVYDDQRILKSPFPIKTPAMAKLEAAIVNDLSHIATLEGVFEFTEDGYKFYEEWYMDKARFPKVVDMRTASYYDRKHIHVLKVAMAVSLSYKDELVLDSIDLRQALALLDGTEPGMRIAFSAVGKNEYAVDMERILAQIATKSYMSIKEIYAYNYYNMGKDKIDQVLDMLRAMGRIRPEIGGFRHAGAAVDAA